MKRPISISIACPAYNEGEGIYELVISWIEFLEKNNQIKNFEICIANDGSTDNTLAVLQEIRKLYSVVKIINLEQNFGAAYALSCAIKASEMDYVFLIDSDGQYDIRNLQLFLDALHNYGADAVVGARIKKYDNLFMKLGSIYSTHICNFIYGTKFKDFNCALKLITRSFINNKLIIEATGLNYSADVLAKLIELDASIIEIDVRHLERKMGVSSAKLFDDARKRVLFVAYLWYKYYLKKIKIIQ